jgi:UDP-glucose 6-dehydrogenase
LCGYWESNYYKLLEFTTDIKAGVEKNDVIFISVGIQLEDVEVLILNKF